MKYQFQYGDGQYGTSWWLDKKDYSKIFKCNILDRNKKYDNVSFSSGGVIVNFEKKDNLEKYYYIDDNLHLLLVGSSGSGKSRSIIIPTITMLGLAGENMFISDVKGELYLYTANKLKELGYDVIAIDYIQFLKSSKYNYLDIVINAVEDGNIALAESLVNDIVNVLVTKNDKTEPIWVNGEMSVIKTAIMAVVLENKGKRKYQTLANAYYFVAEMFKTAEDGEIVELDVTNEPEKPSVDIEKTGLIQTTANEEIRYDFHIKNTGNTKLDKFTWYDYLPTDYVRITKLITGTYNQDLDYAIYYKTNRNDYRLLKDNLNTQVNNYIDFSNIELEEGEYVTEFKADFGTVDIGFESVIDPYIFTTVNSKVKNDDTFTNKTRIEGYNDTYLVWDEDEHTTKVYEKKLEVRKLPRTGF